MGAKDTVRVPGMQVCDANISLLSTRPTRILTHVNRARRIKCDEAKPTCNRCKIGKRTCKYDADMHGPNLALPWAFPQMTPHSDSPLPANRQAQERHLFSVFQNRFVPLMSDVFDRDFWEVSMLRGTHAYPAAWYASLAIGAMYQKLDLGRRGASAYDQQRYDHAALIYCNKTTKLLVEANHTQMAVSEREMLLLACILLMCYANLRQDFAQALVHIANGAYLSKQWNYWKHNRQKSQRLPNCVVPATSISMFFLRLEMQLTSSPSEVPEQLKPATQRIHIDVDSCYESAIEAYIELLPILNAYRQLYQQSSRSDNQRHMLNPNAIAVLNGPFLLWRDKFRAYKRRFWGEMEQRMTDTNEADCIQMLTTWQLLCTVILCSDTSKEELAYDDFNHEFERAMSIYEYLLDVSPLGKAHKSGAWLSNMSSFIGLVGQGLSAVCSGCRVPTIRRRGLRLMTEYPFKDGTTDSKYLVIFLRMKMDLEENGWQRSPIEGGCKCVPDVFICGDHRIRSPVVVRQEDGSTVTFRNLYEVANNKLGFSVFVPSKSKAGD